MGAATEGDRHLSALGSYLRTQRRLAHLSLRQMAELSKVSNPYLSQIERGLHEPSVRILRSIAQALNLSAEDLLKQAGLLGDKDGDKDKEKDTAGAGDSAVDAARPSSDPDTVAVIRIYRGYQDANAKA
jgi:transcriptional regulator with XRE-family HTH domain